MISWFSRYGRMLFVFAWIGLLYLIATNIQAGWLYVVISFLGLLCFFSVLIPRIALRTIRVRLEFPEICGRGVPAAGVCTIENTSRFPRYLVRVDFPEGTGLEFDPPGVLAIKIGGMGSVSFSAGFTPGKRGAVRVDHVDVSCGAPAGIFYFRRKARVSAETLVYPKISHDKGESLFEEAGDSAGGRREKFHAIEDTYHYKLREYTPGDSLNRMHWKLTAKRDRPIVRIHERKIFGHAGILVDNIREHYDAGDEGRFEEILERAISLAYYLVFIRGASVTLSGAAAPGVSVEGTESWEYALRWFAAIRLESVPGGERVPEEADFRFSPTGDLEWEEAVTE